MAIAVEESGLSPLAREALAIYERKLPRLLEPAHIGDAVAIHVDSGEYEVAQTHSRAARALLKRHEADGRIVTLTIGPPTASDLQWSTRVPSSDAP